MRERKTARLLWILLIGLCTWGGIWWQAEGTRWSGDPAPFLQTAWSQRLPDGARITLDPTGTRAAILTPDGQVRILDGDGQPVCEWRAAHPVDSVALTQAGGVAVAFRRGDAAQRELSFFRLDGSALCRFEAAEAVVDAALSLDGKRAACVTAGSVYAIALGEKPTYRRWTTQGTPRQVYVAPDGSLVVVATADPPGVWAYSSEGAFRWKAPSGVERGNALLFPAPDGRSFASVVVPASLAGSPEGASAAPTTGLAAGSPTAGGAERSSTAAGANSATKQPPGSSAPAGDGSMPGEPIRSSAPAGGSPAGETPLSPTPAAGAGPGPAAGQPAAESRLVILSAAGRQQWGARLDSAVPQVALANEGSFAAIAFMRVTGTRVQPLYERQAMLFASRGGASGPQQLWEHGGPFYDPRLVCIAGDGSFAATRDGRANIYFFDQAGEPLWRHRMPTPIASTQSSADGRTLLVTSTDATVTCLRVVGRQGDPL